MASVGEIPGLLKLHRLHSLREIMGRKSEQRKCASLRGEFAEINTDKSDERFEKPC